MSHPIIHYLVNGPNPAPNTAIPTKGKPTSLVDSMRVMGIDHVDQKPDNWVTIDYKVEDALVRLILGNIRSERDLQLAEQAVRAYLFADYLEVFRPAAFSFSKYGVWPHRLSSADANDYAYSLYKDIPSRDVLLITSYVQVEDGLIVRSTSGLTDIDGLPIASLDSKSLTLDKALDHFISSVSLPLNSYIGISSEASLQAASDVVDPTLGRLINIIDRDWHAKIGPMSRRLNGFVLPPFLSVVLHRAQNRELIPESLSQLRAEFADVRRYLVSLEQEIEQSDDERHISSLLHRFDETFSSVIPATLEDEVYENRRPLLQGVNVIITSLALNGYFDMATIGYASSALIQYFHAKSLEYNPNSTRVSKSLVAGKLSRSFRVGSLKKMLEKHLHADELKKLGY